MARRQTFEFSSMVPDLIPEDAPVDAWNYAHNVVFRNGETVAAGADRPVFLNASIVALTMTYVEPFGEAYWVYADETGIFAHDGTNEFDITPADWANHGVLPIWTSDVINGLATINSSNRAPVY